MMMVQKKISPFIEEERDKMRPHTLLFHYQLVCFVLLQFIIIEFEWFIWSQFHKNPKTYMPYLSLLLVCIKAHMHDTWLILFCYRLITLWVFQTDKDGLSPFTRIRSYIASRLLLLFG